MCWRHYKLKRLVWQLEDKSVVIISFCYCPHITWKSKKPSIDRTNIYCQGWYIYFFSVLQIFIVDHKLLKYTNEPQHWTGWHDVSAWWTWPLYIFLSSVLFLICNNPLLKIVPSCCSIYIWFDLLKPTVPPCYEKSLHLQQDSFTVLDSCGWNCGLFMIFVKKKKNWKHH